MFDAGMGLFHLVFANLEDDYYTSDYIRTDFLSYLRLRLLQDGFRYLCFIENTPVGRSREYQMITTDALNPSMLREAPVSKGFLKAIFGKHDEEKDVWESGSKQEKTVLELGAVQLNEYVCDILDKMSAHKGIAVVCPMDIFADCCEDEALLKKFIVRQNKPNRNIFVLTGSVNASDHDRHFRLLARKALRQGGGAFSNGRLFPEIYASACADSKLPNLIFTYDFLKDAFGERMHVLNDLSFEKINLMLRYTALHNTKLPLRYCIECYAAVIFAWYCNESFRRRYPMLNLPDNPFRAMRPIADSAAQNSFYEAADQILQQEAKENDDPEKALEIAEYWGVEDSGAAILYDKAAQKDRLPQIRYYLEAYSRQLKGHEEILSDEEHRDLAMMIRYFSRPSYSHYEGQIILPHERCPEYRTQITELYHSLRKREWNSWDDTAMRLLYVMFRRCYDHSMETEETTPDINGFMGELEFMKCIESVVYCMRCSKERPTQSSMAKYVYQQTKRILSCEDPHTIRAFTVTEAAKDD